MSTSKLAITMGEKLLKRLDRLVAERMYPSRSRAIQAAVEEKVHRMDRGRLARECGKLDSQLEQNLADEGLVEDLVEWPEY